MNFAVWFGRVVVVCGTIQTGYYICMRSDRFLHALYSRQTS